MITVATHLHDNYSHIGRYKLATLIRKYCWSPSLAYLVAELTHSCPLCQVNKPDTGKLAPPVHRRVVLRPYDLVCLDILSLPKTTKGNTHLLVIACHASKWLQCYPMKGHSSEAIIRALKQYIASSIKCPHSLLSDNEPSLCSEQFKQFCLDYDISHIFSASYQPSCNGFSEKNCDMMTAQLRFLSQSITKWDELMPQVVTNHNFSINSSTNMTPSSFILERAHFPEADCVLPSKLASLWRMGNPNFCPYNVGQRVLYKIKYIGNRCIDKLKARFEGIYRVYEVRGNGLTYNICSIWDKNYVKENVHYSDLKIYNMPVGILKMNRVFKEYYKQWRDAAFGEEKESPKVEDDDQVMLQIPGIPGVVTTQPGPVPGLDQKYPVATLVDDGEQSSTVKHSTEDFFLMMAEEQESEEFEKEYMEYLSLREKWNNGKTEHLIEVPKNLFRHNYLVKIREFNNLYKKNSLYFKPYPDGTTPDLGPPDRGVPLALRLLESLEENKLVPDFDFEYLKNIYLTENCEAKREILALTINYNLRYFLCNPLNFSVGLQTSVSGGDQPNDLESTSHPSEQFNIDKEGPPTPRNRKSLLQRFSPLQKEEKWELAEVGEESKVDFSYIKHLERQNTELKEELDNLKIKLEDLTQCMFNMTQNPNISLNSSQNSFNFSPSINSTVRDPPGVTSSSPTMERSVNNSSNNSTNNLPETSVIIKEINAECKRLKGYERC